MDLLFFSVQFIFGCILLYFSSELLIKKSIIMALKFKLSTAVIGVTVVAFGTSLPELLVSIYAGFVPGQSGMIIGNVMGSNIANLALVIGFLGVFYTIRIDDSFKLDIWFMSILGFYIVCCSIFLINLNYIHGLGLILLFILYLRWIISTKKMTDNTSNESEFSSIYDYPLIVISISGLAFGTDFAVNGAVGLAEIFNFTALGVGITIVALGTSLHELFTSVIAIKKNETDLVIGNINEENIRAS